MRQPICLCVSCRAERTLNSYYSPFHSEYVSVFGCINDWVNAYSTVGALTMQLMWKRGSRLYLHSSLYCTFTQCRGTHTPVQASSQPMSPSYLPGLSQPLHPGICSPTTSIIKDRLHKEPKCSSKQTNHTLSVSLSCTQRFHTADYDWSEYSVRSFSSGKYTHNPVRDGNTLLTGSSKSWRLLTLLIDQHF